MVSSSCATPLFTAALPGGGATDDLLFRITGKGQPRLSGSGIGGLFCFPRQLKTNVILVDVLTLHDSCTRRLSVHNGLVKYQSCKLCLLVCPACHLVKEDPIAGA